MSMPDTCNHSRRLRLRKNDEATNTVTSLDMLAQQIERQKNKYSPVAGGVQPTKSSSAVHVVVDNSNLFIGAQVGQGENGRQDASVRINVKRLVDVIHKGKNLSNIKTRIVGGSIPPRNAREVFLDDMLHSQILKLILENQPNQENVQQQLILITGDGNANDDRTSFPSVVSAALRNGWMVDLWAWRASISRKFKEIQENNPSSMKINYLDQHRSEITFRETRQPQQDLAHANSWLLPASIFVICLGIFVFFIKRVSEIN